MSVQNFKRTDISITSPVQVPSSYHPLKQQGLHLQLHTIYLEAEKKCRAKKGFINEFAL